MKDIIIEKFGDYGANTSSRDRYQDHYVAFCCLQMLVDNSITEIICEYGEDIVINRNGTYELHQVKTKQESVNEWKLNDLIPIIGKMFAMVPYFGEVSKCCFISNKGANGILIELKKVINQNRNKWNDNEEEFFENFCVNHASNILAEMKKVDADNTENLEDVKKRLLSLEIETDFHHMAYVQDTNLRTLRKYLEDNSSSMINYTDQDAIGIYDKLMSIIGKATIGRTREEKTINRELALSCIIQPRQIRLLFVSPSKDDIDNAPGRTRLEKKLYLGGFTSPFIEDARELMVAVKNESRKWEFGQAAEILDDIRFRVKHLCVNSYDKVCQEQPTKENIGREMLNDLNNELPRLIDYYKNINLSLIDQLFLEGIAMSLTSDCKVYWSQKGNP